MKIYSQQADYTCGVAIVRTLLAMRKMRVPSEDRLARELGSTNESGTSHKRIFRYLQEHDFEATYFDFGMNAKLLRQYLQKGWLGIIDWADWGGHYILALDYDKPSGWSGGRFRCADPAACYEGRVDGITYVCGDRLDATWFDPIPPPSKGRCVMINAHNEDK